MTIRAQKCDRWVESVLDDSAYHRGCPRAHSRVFKISVDFDVMEFKRPKIVISAILALVPVHLYDLDPVLFLLRARVRRFPGIPKVPTRVTSGGEHAALNRNRSLAVNAKMFGFERLVSNSHLLNELFSMPIKSPRLNGLEFFSAKIAVIQASSRANRGISLKAIDALSCRLGLCANLSLLGRRNSDHLIGVHVTHPIVSDRRWNHTIAWGL